jgi:hypothetical protein
MKSGFPAGMTTRKEEATAAADSSAALRDDNKKVNDGDSDSSSQNDGQRGMASNGESSGSDYCFVNDFALPSP